MIHRKHPNQKNSKAYTLKDRRSNCFIMRFLYNRGDGVVIYGCRFNWNGKESIHENIVFTHEIKIKGSISARERRYYKLNSK